MMSSKRAPCVGIHPGDGERETAERTWIIEEFT